MRSRSVRIDFGAGLEVGFVVGFVVIVGKLFSDPESVLRGVLSGVTESILTV